MKNDFHYVSVLLNMLYGLEMDPEDVEELGLIAWNLIGNKETKLYRYSASIDSSDNSVTLPCNLEELEAVTTPYEDWNRTTNYSDYGSPNSFFVELSIENEKFFLSPYYLPGKLLKFERVGDKLYFPYNYGRVNILYKGILADEEGLPKLTDKEATAIATYIAYVDKFKEGLKTSNANTINMASTLNSLWLKQCDLARVTYLNLNDLNNIVEIAHSWDRAVYNKTGNKPIR